MVSQIYQLQNRRERAKGAADIFQRSAKKRADGEAFGIAKRKFLAKAPVWACTFWVPINAL